MNYIHTLCWNLPNQCEKAVNSLYNVNNKKDFIHFVICLGFPIEGDAIPEDIEHSRVWVQKRLISLANKHGSYYQIFDNQGVSSNWTSVFTRIKQSFGFNETDNLIGADPDEECLTRGWVKAMGDVLSNSDYAIASLMMPEHLPIIKEGDYIEQTIMGVRVWEMKVPLNWGQIGISGRFLLKMGGVPTYNKTPIYGNIESACIIAMNGLGMKWCVLPDYIDNHTDFEKGTPRTSRLLREWKNHIVFSDKEQITFEEFLILKKNNKI